MRKRLLSLLLVLACVLTLAVVPVVAAEPDPVQPTASVTEPTPTTDPEPSPEPSSEPSPEPTSAPSPEPSPVPTPSGPWYQAALDFACDHRILLGDPSGNMMPNDNATRAQMAAMLVRVFGCTAGKDIAHFTDVSTTAWYYSELSTAAQMNIFNGYGDGTMGPNRSITRQEAMIVIARAFAVPDGTAADIQAFRDASSVGSWAVAKVGGLVKAGIVNGDTLQVGIGGIPNAVAYGLHGRKRLGIYTEVLTQAQLRLMASGAVDLDRVEASIVLDAAGHLDDFALAHIRMIPVDVLNDPFRAAQQPGLISVNGCLMADLTGQVCAEAIDGRQYSGVGGQLDFVRAAARSAGGRSFLCLHSTHEAPDGTLTSNIRAHLPSGAVVTTPRSDVMYIVTEWGAADLHNQPLETRICAMIRIAHPRFRCALAQEAVAWGQLSPECAAQFDTQPEPEEEETT